MSDHPTAPDSVRRPRFRILWVGGVFLLCCVVPLLIHFHSEASARRDRVRSSLIRSAVQRERLLDACWSQARDLADLQRLLDKIGHPMVQTPNEVAGCYEIGKPLVAGGREYPVLMVPVGNGAPPEGWYSCFILDPERRRVILVGRLPPYLATTFMLETEYGDAAIVDLARRTMSELKEDPRWHRTETWH